MTGNGQTALVIGATSDIGRAIARRLAAEGYALQLAGRDLERVKLEAGYIRSRSGAAVATHRCDVLEENGGGALCAELDPLPDVAICVVGLLVDQARGERDGAAAERVMRTNYVGPALLLNALAGPFARRGSGILAGVSSVAGDRGRRANYVYGSAKAGFTAFLSGLRNRLAPAGVRVLTIKPGFVRTRMTAGMRLPPLLTATPDEVAAAVAAGLRARRDVIYVRRIWRLLMLVLRIIPERIFKMM